MRNRLTKQAMGKNDSPTTMHVDYANPELSKYESGDPDSWGEEKQKEMPWKKEKRDEQGHPLMKDASKNIYADAVKEAQELEAKALRCLKMAESFLGDDAPSDVIERQAVDFMTMSNKSVLATLRRMREFEENISEARVAKVVDAVLEVIAEEEEEKKAEKEEMKEEKKEASFEDEDSKIAAIVEATLEVLAEEEEEKKAEKEEMKEEKKEAAKEEMKEEEKKAEKEEMKEEKKHASEDELVSKITAAVLSALGKTSGEKEEDKKAEKEIHIDIDSHKEEKEEEKEEKEEEMKEAAKEEMKEEEKKAEKEEMKEEKKEAEKEEMKEAAEEEKKAEKEEMKEEKKEAAEEISFEDGYDVTASDEDSALLSQLFTTKDAGEDFSEKEAKIKTLKNVTASTSVNEIDKLASLWNKEV